MQKVFVDLKKSIDDSYEILIGNNYIENIINEFDNSHTFYIVDKNVYDLYPFLHSLSNVFILEATEKNKNIESVESILLFLKDKNCLRDSKLVAIGGGIIGDIAGFAASIFMRGIEFYQIPTTLLSMVDSSVGGKTGVNLGDTKNLIGAFYQPEAVYIDMNFLNTLYDDEYKNGIAEVIKYALMFDKDFYDILLNNSNSVLERDKILIEIISRCCQIKADVVKEDEREKGLRMYLNYGHTFGHAIETDSNHKIKHGFAVATGMYLETLFGNYLNKYDFNVVEGVKKILEKYDFNLDYKPVSETNFFNAIASDKKARRNGIVVALTQKIGSGMLLKGLSLELIKDFFLSLRS